ncbi:ribonuclease HI [Thiospirillum jenense]|uniref:Ribonuclease H n=1 Tax=Thiospirillum jenense TaxID=1653858 RepID=A0A839HPF7_9GAMM|nr:ribonuclease HI [Thiospirillum jenense]MBB1127112.1 ribonuclease HI [Thiospirillum jenense]
MNDLFDQVDIELFTDGACQINPGPGGWGVLIRHGAQVQELCGGAPATTNNRMELMAVIRGLEATAPGSRVLVTLDSRYVQDGVEQWLLRWRRNGWKTSKGTAVKNQDLWEELQALLARRRVRWQWVPGHSGHVENKRADELAKQGLATVTT